MSSIPGYTLFAKTGVAAPSENKCHYHLVGERSAFGHGTKMAMTRMKLAMDVGTIVNKAGYEEWKKKNRSKG